ncbi:MAG: TrbC/VirB2 family protein [Sphingomonadales bacterium]|nr:TrbC/VirB2 family protein [Sphingomonadales bacterium]
MAAAVDWMVALLSGRLGTSIAVIAFAWTGYLMLQGRFAIRESAKVVLGSFLLFGASAIAHGLVQFAQREGATRTSAAAVSPASVAAPPKPHFDPYAGASLPN